MDRVSVELGEIVGIIRRDSGWDNCKQDIWLGTQTDVECSLVTNANSNRADVLEQYLVAVAAGESVEHFWWVVKAIEESTLRRRRGVERADGEADNGQHAELKVKQ